MASKVQVNFDRHSLRYKQFKVQNTTRTSTPKPSIRPKYQSLRKEPFVHPIPQPPSTCPDVDTQYVSYYQWRHHLVVPNSARKFKVRGIRKPFTPWDKVISGNINMQSNENAVETKGTPRTRPEVQELLNSRINGENIIEIREHIEARNRRIVDFVIPVIKRNLRRLVAATAPSTNQTPPRSSGIEMLIENIARRSFRRPSEERERLIYAYGNEE